MAADVAVANETEVQLSCVVPLCLAEQMCVLAVANAWCCFTGTPILGMLRTYHF